MHRPDQAAEGETEAGASSHPLRTTPHSCGNRAGTGRRDDGLCRTDVDATAMAHLPTPIRRAAVLSGHSTAGKNQCVDCLQELGRSTQETET